MESLNLQHTLFFVDLKDDRRVPRIWVDTMQHPREITVTVGCETDPTAVSQGGHFDINSRLTTQITVILLDRRAPSTPRPSRETSNETSRSSAFVPQEDATTGSDVEASTLGSSIEYLYGFLNRTGSAQLVTSIVGLDAFLPDPEQRTEFVERVEQRVRKSRTITPQQFRERCRFLTHEAYRNEVGDRAYSLRTVR